MNEMEKKEKRVNRKKRKEKKHCPFFQMVLECQNGLDLC